jgi:GT2 family glycosyltransferase
MTASTALDIIIVNFNTATDLRRCVRSIDQHRPACPMYVTVVDNASSDGSVEMIRRDFPAITVHALKENVGFAAANNIGIRATTAPLMLLLNSDTEVGPGALDALIGRLEATDAAVAGPRLVGRDGHPELSWGPMLTPWQELRQMLRMRVTRSRLPLGKVLLRRLLGRERWVDWVSGACLLVRRHAAEAVGLLDERYFMYEEDVDFCAAIRAHHGRVLFTPAAQIVHARGRSGAPSRFYTRSHIEFYRKHAPAWVPAVRLWHALRGRRAE